MQVLILACQCQQTVGERVAVRGNRYTRTIGTPPDSTVIRISFHSSIDRISLSRLTSSDAVGLSAGKNAQQSWQTAAITAGIPYVDGRSPSATASYLRHNRSPNARQSCECVPALRWVGIGGSCEIDSQFLCLGKLVQKLFIRGAVGENLANCDRGRKDVEAVSVSRLIPRCAVECFRCQV